MQMQSGWQLQWVGRAEQTCRTTLLLPARRPSGLYGLCGWCVCGGRGGISSNLFTSVGAKRRDLTLRQTQSWQGEAICCAQEAEGRVSRLHLCNSRRGEKWKGGEGITQRSPAVCKSGQLHCCFVFCFFFGTSSCKIRGQRSQSNRGLLLRESFNRLNSDFSCKK